ncbi:MAG: histidinol-phosphate transaminase [Pseudomonadota bacterium]|nr:histidinol-phosphate transaminase [Pseudomonadota bacterium]
MEASGELDEAWFSARARGGIGGLRAYDPGHDLVALRERHALREPGGFGLVELGSNENPYGPSPDARAAILDQLHQLHRYPDPRGSGLKRALARHHGVRENQIQLGNGSHELLMQLAQVFAAPGDEVVVPQFGFAVFSLAAQASGAAVRVAPALPASDAMPLGHDPRSVLDALTPRTRLLYLANPNNPTGTWLPGAAIEQLVQAVPREVIVVVDEAYAELVDDAQFTSATALLDRHPNLVVTRTFSKAYGLAGLRVGYLLAAPGLVAVMERVRESFNVGGPALAACAAALADEAHLQWVRQRNAEQRAQLGERLRARGLRVFPSQTNFLLVDFGRDAGAVEAALLDRGVVLRPMRGYGLSHCLRVTVGTRDENLRFLAALDLVLA